MPAPVRFPSGVTNVGPNDLLGMHLSTDPSRMHTNWNDFNSFAAADWTITKVGAGTTALGDLDHGVLVVTNAAGVADSVYLQKVGSDFFFESGKQLWFKARFKLSDATLTTAIMGLQITDTTPLAVSNGVFFIKGAAAATLDFLVEAASTATTASAIATMVDDTYMTVGFYYDGKTEISYWVDVAGNHPGNDVGRTPQKLGTLALTNLPLSTQALTISYGVKNGEAVAKVMSVDYILVAKERF